MNTVSEILKNEYSDQGIQNLEIFYDTLILRLKIKDAEEYKDTVLIEKIEFDYASETIQKLKNGIMINFGDSLSPLPYTTSGNTFLGNFLDNRDKGVWIVGLRTLQNGNTIPVIYRYDINAHSVNSIFPDQQQLEEFQNLNNSNYISLTNPVVQYSNSRISIAFLTTNSELYYINLLVIKVSKTSAILESYNMFEYSDTTPELQLTGVDSTSIFYSIGDYHGKFELN